MGLEGAAVTNPQLSLPPCPPKHLIHSPLEVLKRSKGASRCLGASLNARELTGTGIMGLCPGGNKTKQYPVSWEPAAPSALDMEPMVADGGTGRSRRGCSQPPLS